MYAEAEAASGKVVDVAGADLCSRYVQYSVAWADLERSARKHQDACDVAPALLADIKRHHRAAVAQRVEACGGLRASKADGHLFPLEIRPRW
ncbi:hypothetical protein SSBR45G_28880 [Bradyrhizobium sp. SSBR45G]|nr:hypothetical protein SSBR45G_28880 [Bradyrhizobium sp. SSBR45G]GLH85398.1 hypothetical protein SSBR45R_28580 [Bradyrhizobium sp. SSBR45R]